MSTSNRDPAGLIRRAVPADAETLTAIAQAAKRLPLLVLDEITV